MLFTRTVLTFCALALSTPVLAMPPKHGPPGAHHRPPPHEIIRQNADELGINDATVHAIVEIAEDAREALHGLHEGVRDASKTLHQLLGEDTPDRKAVLHQVAQLKQAEAAVQKHQLTVLMDIRALLSPAQRDAIKALHQKMKSEGPPHGRRGPPKHRGGPPHHRGGPEQRH
jgi:Spy/CpxP family protein refolding chaperone